MSFRPSQEGRQTSFADGEWGLSEGARRMLEASWAHVFATEVYPMIDEAPFAALYSDNPASRPNLPVRMTVGALILKELFRLTDEGLVEQLTFNTLFQHALNTDAVYGPPLSTKHLQRFRRACVEHEAETGRDLVRECMVGVAHGIERLMGITGAVERMDSTMVASNIRALGRAELIYECVALCCRQVTRRGLGELPDALAPYARDGNRNKVFYHDRREGRSSEADVSARVLGDADLLAATFGGALAGAECLELLRRALVEQTVVEDGNRRLRTKEDGMPGSSMMQSPYDPDATFRRKAGRDHRGYAANFVESCGEGGTVVTDYDYAPNNTSDQRFLRDHLERAEAVEDGVIVTDGGYCGDEGEGMAREKGFELLTTDLTGREPRDIHADIEWGEDGTEMLSCPAGRTPDGCSHYESSGQVRATFDAEACRGCPLRERCGVKIGKARASLTSSPKATRRARHARRTRTEEFRDFYRLRNGSETIPSLMKNRYGIDGLPRGTLRGKLFLGFKVGALNLAKLLAFRRGRVSYAKNPVLRRGSVAAA